MPCFEPVRTIALGVSAEALARNCGRNVEIPLTAPKKFVSKIYLSYQPSTFSRHNPTLQHPNLHTLWKTPTSSIPPLVPMPAFSTRKFTAPNFCPTLTLSPFQSSILETSAAYVSTSTSPRDEATVARFSMWMSTRASFMPCLAHSCARARPMPEAAPVIRAVEAGRKMG